MQLIIEVLHKGILIMPLRIIASYPTFTLSKVISKLAETNKLSWRRGSGGYICPDGEENTFITELATNGLRYKINFARSSADRNPNHKCACGHRHPKYWLYIGIKRIFTKRFESIIECEDDEFELARAFFEKLDTTVPRISASNHFTSLMEAL